MPVNCRKKSGKRNPPGWRQPESQSSWLTIAAGCVPSVGLQGSIFVLLPYAVQLAAACSLAWACARLWGKEYPLREYVYQQTVCKISLRGGICIAAAGVSVIGELAELTRHSDKLLSSIPFLLIEVIMALPHLHY